MRLFVRSVIWVKIGNNSHKIWSKCKGIYDLTHKGKNNKHKT